MQQQPPYISALETYDSSLLETITNVREFVLADGALSAKTKVLMMVLSDSLLSHPTGVRNLANRARSLGATEGEISETVRVAYLMGGLPGLVTGCNAFPE
ncbi:carboxymuconolactone decarboxylase family protein [SAR202 cluster bacterium AD-804-J14_MRT_500m]|nr:carboxymuconolactone decarboxylase family protein [SAR202 cluster bacterium AD-804-J14_MRT_500m]